MAQAAMMAIQAAGSIVGGIEQHGALKKSAKVDQNNAKLAELQGELDSWQTEREARLAIGAGMAEGAAMGNPVGTGSFADLVEQSAREREREIVNLRSRARGEASNLRASAKAKKKAAGFALVKGFLQAAGDAASAVSTAKNAERVSSAGARDRASQRSGPLARGAPTKATSSRMPRTSGQVRYGSGPRTGSSNAPGI